MSDADIKRLIYLAEKKLCEPLTAEEALQSLVDAGILDKNGNYTPPYEPLARVEHR